MKERPILFSATMVRAILAGTKTQTRRVVKSKHVPWLDLPWLENSVFNFLDGKWNQRQLPYGQPGDRLWVRESFRLVRTVLGGADGCKIPPSKFLDSTRRFEADGAVSYPDARMRVFGKLRPGIHMPRWASRITLEVTGVRVERLQGISEADARAEGYPGGPDDLGAIERPLLWYRELWESINGHGSWDENPWVWVVEFKRVDA